jgi:hypothetical protein
MMMAYEFFYVYFLKSSSALRKLFYSQIWGFISLSFSIVLGEFYVIFSAKYLLHMTHDTLSLLFLWCNLWLNNWRKLLCSGYYEEHLLVATELKIMPYIHNMASITFSKWLGFTFQPSVIATIDGR